MGRTFADKTFFQVAVDNELARRFHRAFPEHGSVQYVLNVLIKDMVEKREEEERQPTKEIPSGTTNTRPTPVNKKSKSNERATRKGHKTS